VRVCVSEREREREGVLCKIWRVGVVGVIVCERERERDGARARAREIEKVFSLENPARGPAVGIYMYIHVYICIYTYI